MPPLRETARAEERSGARRRERGTRGGGRERRIVDDDTGAEFLGPVDRGLHEDHGRCRPDVLMVRVVLRRMALGRVGDGRMRGVVVAMVVNHVLQHAERLDHHESGDQQPGQKTEPARVGPHHRQCITQRRSNPIVIPSVSTTSGLARVAPNATAASKRTSFVRA